MNIKKVFAYWYIGLFGVPMFLYAYTSSRIGFYTLCFFTILFVIWAIRDDSHERSDQASKERARNRGADT